jgi:hypothetical protein
MSDGQPNMTEKIVPALGVKPDGSACACRRIRSGLAASLGEADEAGAWRL